MDSVGRFTCTEVELLGAYGDQLSKEQYDQVWLKIQEKLQMNEAKKYDENKPKLSTVPTDVLNDIAKAFTYGANKYGKYNYSGGMDHSRLYDASFRHLNAYWNGEDIDIESGNHHIDHAIASLVMLKHMINNNVGTDDRNKIYNKLKQIETNE